MEGCFPREVTEHCNLNLIELMVLKIKLSCIVEFQSLEVSETTIVTYHNQIRKKRAVQNACYAASTDCW